MPPGFPVIPPPTIDSLLHRIRALGWSVAVHNDYRENGVQMTFWLFTHPSGNWLKGEGRTDVEALTPILNIAAGLEL